MSITTELTVAKLTPPGYFDLSGSASSKHRDYITWFQQQLDVRAEQTTALTTMVLTPWLVEYNDSPRVPWVSYLLKTYGFGFFGGTNNQAASLYKLISGSWDTSTITNIKTVLDAFCLPPFSWFDATDLPMIYSGILVPSVTDTGFLIYSTASSPSTPSNTAYASRTWTVPSGWTRAASSSVTYCRGYLSGSNIIWCAPRPVKDFERAVYFSASVPLSAASAGTICIVDDDSTGDRRSVYYSDGTAWRKNSLANAELGLVPSTGERPTPEAVTVWAPNPSSVTYTISSSLAPPTDGYSQGYGTFAGWAGTDITNNELVIKLNQSSGGNIAIATLLAVLRRIKPESFGITVKIDDVDYTVTDARAAS
jgi:hypothetical protein